MDILEMHISIEQGLQEINSFAFGNVLPEEIDMAINKEIDRYIKTHSNPKSNKEGEGFEQSEKRFSDLGLMAITDFKDSEITECVQIDTNEWEFSIPSNCHMLTKRNVQIYYNSCRAITPIVSNKTAAVSVIQFNPNKYSLADYRSLMVKFVDDQLVQHTLFDASSYPNILDYTIPEHTETFKAFFMNEVNRMWGSVIKCYYEVYKDMYEKDSFIFVDVQKSSLNTILFYYDFPNSIFDEDLFSIHNYITVDTMSESTKVARLGITSHDRIDVLKNDSFASSDDEIVLCTMSGNKLKLYTDDTKFIPIKGIVSYIKKPRKVSLALGINCELNSSVHQEIVDLTVAYLSKINSNQNVQILEFDSQKTE